ncbi:MAG TPA: hypothetical protein VHC70_11475 [Phycisphaerales bacterium]|jgi:protein-S-isoprenylcysteine O-methyltransferase Ste14|nr:hypothetical protein [Phycisphaerales bacterium]
MTATQQNVPVRTCPFHRLPAPTRGAAGVAAFLYGLLAYAAFFISFAYAALFVGNWLVPKTIDSGNASLPTPVALVIDGLLLIVFVLQHTIMARPAFKRWWTKIVPTSIERSTFVLLASASLGLMLCLWQPAPHIVWRVTSPAAFWGLTILSIVGYVIVFAASCMVSHFDLFGLRQVWFRVMGRAYEPIGFRLRGLYKLVRHPLMLGFLIAFWATPTMTVGHLFFAIMTTLYIRFGTWMEERDLIAEHGETYLAYRRAVPGILPIRGNAAARLEEAAA